MEIKSGNGTKLYGFPVQIGEIDFFGAFKVQITDEMDLKIPTKKQIENLRDNFGIDVKIFNNEYLEKTTAIKFIKDRITIKDLQEYGSNKMKMFLFAKKWNDKYIEETGYDYLFNYVSEDEFYDFTNH